MNCFTTPKPTLLGTVQGMATQHPTPALHQQQHDFKGLQDWIEVFYAGSHTDAQGRACDFTNGDLDQMVGNLTTLGAAPLVIGHPKHDDPAYGWVSEAKRDGERLFIKARDVNPAFEAGVNSGAYRNRSLRVAKTKDHGWRIQHVGWLGAALPALEGMQPLSYAANAADGETFDFAGEYSTASALDDIQAVLRSLRESVIAKDGLEAADAMLPEWRISAIGASAERVRQAALAEPTSNPASPFFNQPTTGASAMSFTQADLDRTAAETEARVRAEAALQFTQQSAELAQLQAARQAERIGVQITNWKACGQLLPAEEAGLAEFMAALEVSGAAREFSFTAAGAAAATAKTPAQFFADFVAARGQLVRLSGPVVTETTAAVLVDQADYRVIATAANEFIASEGKAGRVVDIAQAVSHVTRKA